MTLYLLDTNHLSAALNADGDIREKLRDFRLRGDRVGTCVPVLCELQVDIMLAALAKQMSATLVSTDRDFEAVPGLPAESWLPQ